MDAGKLQDWLQVIGLFGVIASLVFVGLQIKQDRDIAIADIYQQRAALVIQVQTSMMEDDRFADAWLKMMTNQALDQRDQARMDFWNNPWLSYYENNHFQYQLGLLSEEQWFSSRNSMRSLVLRESFERWWVVNRSRWRESFAQEIDDLIAEEAAKNLHDAGN